VSRAAARVPSPLALEEDGTFACPHCAAIYEVDHLHLPIQDEGEEACEACGETMARWRSSLSPVFKKAAT
jgi:predicted Zn finger-like uncharacterized protein